MKKIMALLLVGVLMIGGCGSKEVEPVQETMETKPTAEVATEVEEAEAEEPVEAKEEASEEVEQEEEEPFIVTFEPDPEGLSALATKHGIHVGAAIDLKYNKIEAYKSLMTNEFNTIVLENMMKWETTNPAEGRYMYAGSDVAAYIAKEHGMKMRGHALVWHQQVPDWIMKKTNEWTKEEILEIIETYITNVAGHFRGSVYSWDVLNEVIEDDGTMRESMFYRITGDEFIRVALETAREADPDARLLINDYSVETINPKSDALYNLVKGLIEEGVPIDGVGFQCHLVLGQTDFDSMEENVRRFQDLGLAVEFTEIDIRIEAPITDEDLQLQKEEYKRLMTMALDLGVDTFVVWGIHDGHTWVTMWFPGFGAPLMFDKTFNPKPAYEGVKEALLEYDS